MQIPEWGQEQVVPSTAAIGIFRVIVLALMSALIITAVLVVTGVIKF